MPGISPCAAGEVAQEKQSQLRPWLWYKVIAYLHSLWLPRHWSTWGQKALWTIGFVAAQLPRLHPKALMA